MDRSEALALGLKTYPSRYRCRPCGTNVRVTWSRACIACKQRDKANKDARQAAAVEKARASIMPGALTRARRQLEAEARQRQREAEREAKRAAKATEKEARKKAAAVAKAKATRERNKAAKSAQTVDTQGAVALPPLYVACSASIAPWDDQ